MKEKMKKEARKKMLKKLKSSMNEDMYNPMKENMQKVTVASDSAEGLKEGLSKAQEILKKKKEMMGDDYACGGTKKDKYMKGGVEKMSKADKIKQLMKKRK